LLYLLYWYTSTNTDAALGMQSVSRTYRFTVPPYSAATMGSDPKSVLVWLHPQGTYNLLASLVQKYSLYWYKSTKSVLNRLHPQGALFA
jgi:hypothetical protein